MVCFTGASPNTSKPTNMILSKLHVPCVCIDSNNLIDAVLLLLLLKNINLSRLYYSEQVPLIFGHAPLIFRHC